jgi:hypothetical protein
MVENSELLNVRTVLTYPETAGYTIGTETY